MVKQVSIFVENKTGRLAEVTKVLGDNNIDISALSIADTTDFGILRIIVNKPDEAEKILNENGFTVSSTDVIAIAIPDTPGSLSKALKALDNSSIGIEYMYAFVGKLPDEALVIIRTENPETAVELLEDSFIRVLDEEEVYSL
jgi:ACT domain-containing protein